MAYKKSDIVKAKIRSTTLDLLYEKGYENLRADELAKKAGVAKGTIFYHFENMEQLVADVVRETTMQLFNGLRESVITLPPFHALEQTFKVLFSKPQGKLPWDTWFEDKMPPQFHYVTDQCRSEVILPLIIEIIEKGVSNNSFKASEVRMTSEIIYNGFSNWLHHHSHEFIDDSVHRKFIDCAENIINELLKPTKRPLKFI